MDSSVAADLAEYAENIVSRLPPDTVHHASVRKVDRFLIHGSAGILHWIAMVDIGIRGGSTTELAIYDGREPILIDRLVSVRGSQGDGVPFLRLSSKVDGDQEKLRRNAFSILRNFCNSIASGKINEADLQKIRNRYEGASSGSSIRAWRG